MHQMLTKEECRQIVDWLHERKLEFYLESNSGLYASEEFEKAAQGSMQEYSRRKGREAPLSIRDAFPEMIFGADLYREDVNKISYLLNSYQDFLETKARFPELQNGTWGGAGETALFGDLGVKEITKACAIETLLKHLNQKQENTIAVGDAKIDIPMLEYCNIGVAMGNGGEEIKKMADYITDDVEKDGLWNAFRHFELI